MRKGLMAMGAIVALSLGALAKPPVTLEGTWKMDPTLTSGLYGPLRQKDQVMVLKSEGPNVFRVEMTAQGGNWKADDLYRLDGEPTNFRITAPDGTCFEGVRRARWNSDKSAVLMDEDVRVATFIGPVKVTRTSKISFDESGPRLMVDSYEESPLGKKNVHRVYTRTR